MKKYLCPICKREVSEYGEVCCGRQIITPKGASSSFKLLFVCVGIPLSLFAFFGMGQLVAKSVRDWRAATRRVDTGIVLPLTATNTTVLTDANGDVTHYITPGGELKAEIMLDERDRFGQRKKDFVVMDTDVRSIEYAIQEGYSSPNTALYIKSDNSLWGYGSNADGFLGNGTGVDAEKPVKIMDDVAKLWIQTSHSGYRTYAIGIDNILWMWGRGKFSPIQVTEDVVALLEASYGAEPMIQKSDGLLYLHKAHTYALERLNPFAMFDVIGSQNDRFASQSGFYINGDGALIEWTSRFGGMFAGDKRKETEITQNVDSLWGDYNNVLLLKSDSTLWALGLNTYGELGDGTKVARDTPVRIADNVVSAGHYFYLKMNGELWAWDNDNPTPARVLGNVATILYNDSSLGKPSFRVLLNDGTFMRINYSQSFGPSGSKITRNEQIIHSGIKIPQAILFD